MNQAPFFIAAHMKDQNTFLFNTTSGRRASTGRIWGFLQEKLRYFLRIHWISHQSIICLPSLRFMIVSWISFVVITLFCRCYKASHTISIQNSSNPILINSLFFHSSYLSSAPITYCLTRAFSFSGRMQNIHPISFGLSFSSYLKCKISLMFPKKFHASWVHGLATLSLLSIFFFYLKSSSSTSSSGSSRFCEAYCLRVWTLSFITTSPVIEGQSKLPLDCTYLRLLNSASWSLSSFSNSMNYSSRALRLSKIKVVKICFSWTSLSI